MDLHLKDTETAIALFADRPAALHAVSDLQDMGIDPKHIGVVMRETDTFADPTGEYRKHLIPNKVADTTVAGGIVGATAILFIPVVGPLLAAGSVLGGMVLGALVSLKINRDDAHYYFERIQNGATLVTVTAPVQAAEVMAVLRRHGGEIGRDASAATPPAAEHAPSRR
jgi:hypothetical protein